jgi:hypothetical protein
MRCWLSRVVPLRRSQIAGFAGSASDSWSRETVVIGKAFLLIQPGHWAVPMGAPADRVGLPGSSTAVGL